MAFLSWLWESILYFLGFELYQDPSDPSSIQIFIKTSSSSANIPLVISREDMTIGDLKAQGILPSNDYELIFQGRVLSDDVVLLRDCDLGNATVLDTVKRKNIASSNAPIEEYEGPKTLRGLQLNSEESSTSKGAFFLFCKECDALRSAKLRVRCANCHSGAILLFRDPCSWEDVLIQGSIQGSCISCESSNTPSEFIFKCSLSFHSKDSSGPPLYLIKSNRTRSVPCASCGDVEDTVLVFECEERHVLCIDCFRLYGLSHLNERSFVLDEKHGYSLGCPIKCPDSLIRETKHFHLLGKDQYDRYNRFAAEEYVLRNGGVLCPRPGCGMGIMSGDSSQRKVTCNLPEGCGFSFCRNCLNGYHISPECDVMEPPSSSMGGILPLHDSDRVRSARWDSLATIQASTKPCPECRTPTERSGGCMHMICSRCSLEWCWMCQDAWTRSCMGDHWFG